MDTGCFHFSAIVNNAIILDVYPEMFVLGHMFLFLIFLRNHHFVSLLFWLTLGIFFHFIFTILYNSMFKNDEKYLKKNPSPLQEIVWEVLHSFFLKKNIRSHFLHQLLSYFSLKELSLFMV